MRAEIYDAKKGVFSYADFINKQGGRSDARQPPACQQGAPLVNKFE